MDVHRHKAVTIVMMAAACSIAASESLTESPVSVSTVVGKNAQFNCSGIGITVVWLVDEFYATDSNITARGILQSNPVTSSGRIHSTLTVPATSVNNGTVVQCRIVSLGGFAISNTATLTVLPGIGEVVNVRFTPSFSAVLWNPPATAGVLSGLSYIVIVMNNNTGQVIVSATTNNTNYPLPILEHCQYYTVNVTAFSSEYHSDSVVTGQRTPGEYYDLKSVSSQPVVVSYNTTHCAITFTVEIQKNMLAVVCPDQDLMSVTYPKANSSSKTPHTGVAITQPGVMQYTAYVEKGCHCASDIMIVTVDKGIIEMKTVLFSSYNVQDCDVSTDNTSILVECTFAINSTAPGVAVVQDDRSQYTINKTLHKPLDDEGSVNITGLPPGEYNASVYDNMKDDQPAAYEHPQLMHIIAPQLTSTPFLTAADTYTTVYHSASPTVNPVPPIDPNINIISIVIAVAVAVVVIAGIITTVCVILMVHKKVTEQPHQPQSTAELTRVTNTPPAAASEAAQIT